jgi:hypothetical protein
VSRRLDALVNGAVYYAGLALMAVFICWDRLTKHDPITEDTTP